MATSRNARVTVTLSNVATDEQLEQMEERIMSALTDAVASLRTAVESAVTRLGDPTELQTALVEERRIAAELAASEAAEDVAQNEELAAAQAEVDRLLAEQSGAATELTSLADRLNGVETAVSDAPAGTPVEDVEVPDAGGDLPPAPAPDATGDAAAAPAAGDVAGADVTPVAPAGGPVDASGNPVAGPAV